MPRIAKHRETSRLTLEIASEVRADLEAIRDDTIADSLVEVVRRAVRVYKFLLSEQANGCRILVESKDDGSRKEVVLL